ncbi:MAG: efflux RND transporter periplasmic adaptor subunit [Candidatus Rokubacteria bacterium]|nr:efflux RND transporter periplasmic adaptor subunit [Candidatus Rokubacteria bacterium]
MSVLARARDLGRRTVRTRAGAIVLAVVIATGASVAYVRWVARPALPEGLIQANGRIEGDRITISAKLGGRVQRLLAREGDTVEPNQVLVVLDDAQAEARVAQARAALAYARERVREAEAAVAGADAGVSRAAAAVAEARAQREHARQAVTSVDARLAAASTGLAVLRREVDVGVATAEAGLAHAAAVVARAEAADAQTRRDADRARRLMEQELIEPQRAEQAELTWIAARSELASARSAVAQAQQQLADARLGPERIRVREDEIRALDAQRAQAHAGVAQADAALDRAQVATAEARAVLERARAALRQAEAGRDQAAAAVTEMESVRGDLTIVAPAAGVVTTRLVDAGEVVGAGAPLLDLVDLDRLYLKVFVPETAIGKLRLGLPARVHVDAWPSESYAATLRHIASRAEFTPKEVQTPDERVKLVYAVKLYLDRNPEHRLTPGLPADAIIRWKERTPWQRPRW